MMTRNTWNVRLAAAIWLLAFLSCLNSAVPQTPQRYQRHTPTFTDVFPHTRSAVINHLLNDGIHRGKFTRSQLEQMSDKELLDLHSDDHAGTVDYKSLPQARTPPIANPRPTKRPRIFVFSSAVCPACRAFEKDLANPSLKEFDDIRSDVTVVKYSGGRWSHPEAAASFTRTTGKPITAVPVFWVEGTKEYRTNYSATPTGRAGFCQWIRNVFASIARFIRSVFVGDDPPPTVIVNPTPTTSPPPAARTFVQDDAGSAGATAATDAEIAKNLTIIILAAKTELSGIADTVIDLGVNGLRGRIEEVRIAFENRLFEKFGGKVRVRIVAERFEPELYAALCTEVGVTPKPVYLLALVNKLSLGIKGFVLGKLESIFEDKYAEKVRKYINFVFERIDQASYSAVMNLLWNPPVPQPAQPESPEVPVEPAPRIEPVPDPISVIDQHELVTAIGKQVEKAVGESVDNKIAPLDLILQQRDQDTAAQSKAIEAKLTEAEEKQSLPARIIAAIHSFVAGSGIVYAIRKRLRDKAEGLLVGKLDEILGNDAGSSSTGAT